MDQHLLAVFAVGLVIGYAIVSLALSLRHR